MTAPLVGRSMAGISLSSVDLPAPQRPVMNISLPLGRDALYLADLFHEMQLRRQSTRRVGDHDVDAARPRRRQRVVDDGARIAGRLRDDRDVVALAPDDELLARRCAEGIARSK